MPNKGLLVAEVSVDVAYLAPPPPPHNHHHHHNPHCLNWSSMSLAQLNILYYNSASVHTTLVRMVQYQILHNLLPRCHIDTFCWLNTVAVHSVFTHLTLYQPPHFLLRRFTRRGFIPCLWNYDLKQKVFLPSAQLHMQISRTTADKKYSDAVIFLKWKPHRRIKYSCYRLRVPTWRLVSIQS
jgi:hypothetical protein